MDLPRRNIESDLSFINASPNHAGFNYQFCQRDNRVATHGAVAFVVQKEDVSVRVGRRRNNRAIHIGVAAWLPDNSSPNVIVVLAEVASLLEDGVAFNWR